MAASNVARLAEPTDATVIARLARQQRDRHKALRRLGKLRKKATAEIDRLIAFLDQSDPYVMGELEECHDGAEPDHDGEPWLGWTTSGAMGEANDRELDNCDREDDDPNESKHQPLEMSPCG